MQSKSLKVLLFSILLVLSTQLFAESALTAITDTAITGIIRTKIAMDQSLSNYQVNVTTNDGVVTLTGTVKTKAEAAALIESTQSVSGVKDVNTNKLTIAESKQPFTDMAITAKVKGLYLREKLLGRENIPPMSINVETNNGIVSLTGKAETQDEINNAILLAKSVVGVKNVESRIKLTQ